MTHINRKNLLLQAATAVMTFQEQFPVYGNSYEPAQNFAANSNPTPISQIKKNQGMEEFVYGDGFSCWAINQKNADRKHTKWLRENSINTEDGREDLNHDSGEYFES